MVPLSSFTFINLRLLGDIDGKFLKQENTIVEEMPSSLSPDQAFKPICV